MALLYMDSFDHYVTADLLEKWTTNSAGTISAGNGRHSSASLRFTGGNGTVTKTLASSGATAVLGFAARVNTLGSGVALVGIHNSAANQDHVSLRMNADGTLTAYRAGSTGIANSSSMTALGTTAAPVFSANSYNYIELKVVLHGSTGSVVVRVNGATVLNLTGQNTTQGTLVWNLLWFSDNSVGVPTLDVDDLYVLDGSGSAPWNDLLGDCRVDLCVPTAAGATTGWTPSAGANWQNVDDAAPNDDTDYNSAATSPLTDTFVVTDAPGAGATVYGVQHCLALKKTDAGAASIAPVVRHAGVDYPGTVVNPGTGYAYILQLLPTNPGTGAQWTASEFNAAEFGYKRTA